MKKQELINQVREYFNENIPFNKHIGIEILDLSIEEARLKIEMKPELVGNAMMNILHGGVTASMLDVAGGLAAIAHTIDKLETLDQSSLAKKLKTLGTIDMRIDYVLPGKGDRFEAKAKVIRHGRKVCVTRMELSDENGQDIALGTATYIVG